MQLLEIDDFVCQTKKVNSCCRIPERVVGQRWPSGIMAFSVNQNADIFVCGTSVIKSSFSCNLLSNNEASDEK